MLGLCVTLNEEICLVSVGIIAFLGLGQNTQEHRFQQPQLWVSNKAVAMMGGFVCFLSVFLVSSWRADNYYLCLHCFQEKPEGTDSGP